MRIFSVVSFSLSNLKFVMSFYIVQALIAVYTLVYNELIELSQHV